MDQMMGGGEGNAGFPIETWWMEMPVCTRYWTTATVLTSALVQCQIITPFQLFYSFRAVFVKNQVPSICPVYGVPTDSVVVLASTDNLLILRPAIPRSRLPRLLPHTVLSTARRIRRPITSSILVVIALCNFMSDSTLTTRFYALLGPPFVINTGVHLVETESRDETEFLGSLGLHGAISTVGLDGLQPYLAWERSQG